MDTAMLLAGALGLDGRGRDLFVAAARGRGPAEDVLAAAARGTAPGAFAAAATRGLPRDIASFTGRRAELARVMESIDALAADGGLVGIHAIDGMAGIGKTTFAVHAAHRLADGFLTGKYRPGQALPASERAEDAAAYLTEHGLAVLGALDTVAERNGAPIAAVALAWLAAQPTVAAPLASARTPRQLQDLLQAPSLRLTADELALLSTASTPDSRTRPGPERTQ